MPSGYIESASAKGRLAGLQENGGLEQEKMMTKKEFKRAMCCGLGRCILELETGKDKEAYRDIVLWGCTRALAYDVQCEGTRGWYLYRLARCFPDADYFVEQTIPHFYRSSDKAGWAFDQFCDFLGMFAGDENRAARHALWANYHRMYELLRSKRRRLSNGRLPLFENFEALCIALVRIGVTREGAEAVFIRVVQDVGNLMLENPLLHTWSFDWFQACQEHEFGTSGIRRILTRRAKESAGVAYYVAAMLREQKGREAQSCERREARANLTAREVWEKLRDGAETDRLFFVMQTRLMMRRGSADDVQKLAGLYRAERAPHLRARLLELFANRDCADLLDAETVILDAKSEDCGLRDAAFRVLAHMHGEAVRRFALELWRHGARPGDVIDMLANNYQAEDHDRLTALVRALPVTYRERDVSWHGAFLAILDLLERRGVKRPPKELLWYMYEHTLCSCCREYILREMARRRMLTKELLQECQYDCSEAVREYAFEKLRSMC